MNAVFVQRISDYKYQREPYLDISCVKSGDVTVPKMYASILSNFIIYVLFFNAYQKFFKVFRYEPPSISYGNLHHFFFLDAMGIKTSSI